MFRQPARDHVVDAFTKVHCVVADSLEEASDRGQLNCHLHVDTTARVGLKDLLHELLLQTVEFRVEVVNARRFNCVFRFNRMHRGAEQCLSFGAHLLHQVAEHRINCMTMHSPRCLTDVHGEPKRSLHFRNDANECDDLAQITRNGSLQCQNLVAVILQRNGSRFKPAFLFDQFSCAVKIASGDDLRGPPHSLARDLGELDDFFLDAIEFLLKSLTQFHHVAALPTCVLSHSATHRACRAVDLMPPCECDEEVSEITPPIDLKGRSDIAAGGTYRYRHCMKKKLAVMVISLVTVTGCSSSSTNSTIKQRNMRGQRYCEILLVSPGSDGLTAEVFNTYPLNDCPTESWNSLDTKAIAKAEGVPIAIANGPRFWLMNAVAKADASEVFEKTFGTLAMNRYANVFIGTPADVAKSYLPHAVNRRAAFTFNKGETIYTLRSADEKTYVMQSWSQQVDPNLVESGLSALGDRLKLPAGWTFVPVLLSDDFVVETRSEDAQVLQDELRNSYSYVANAPE